MGRGMTNKLYRQRIGSIGAQESGNAAKVMRKGPCIIPEYLLAVKDSGIPQDVISWNAGSMEKEVSNGD